MNQPGNDINRISIHRYLMASVATIVSIPVFVLMSYFLVDSYRASIERANFSVQKELDGQASNLTSTLHRLQYQIADFSRNKAIGEMAVNILLAQFAHNKLQELVEGHPELEAGFISDGSNFIMEGYPNHTYKMKVGAVSARASELMSDAGIGQLPKLEIMSANSLYDDAKPDEKVLLFVIPLFKKMQSIITPDKVTSVLFIIVDLNTLLQNFSGYDQVRLSFGDVRLHDRTLGLDTDIIAASTQVSDTTMDSLGSRELQLQIGINEQEYLARFRQNISYSVVFIVTTLVFVGVLVFRLSKKLKRPVNDLSGTANKFLKGNYAPVAVEQEYIEFAQTIDAMNQMAVTIEAQISNLSEAKLQAEKSEEAKSQFLANMSHEIRTPMNGVLGLLDVLKGKVSDQEQLQLLQHISDSAKTLLTIVNDILDLSKLEAGKLQIESINFNVKQLLLNMAKTYGHNLKEKGLKLQLDVKGLSQDWWQGDPVRLTQVLNNLVSNAIKFTEQGNIVLKVASVQEGTQSWLAFSCEDSGIGLTEEQRQRLFNKFEQADNSTTRRYGGTGLGLSICKLLVELMQGEIKVTSEPGKGSQFQFNVRVKPGCAEENIEEDTLEVPNLAQFRVLIAEDNQINQDILRYLLEETHIQANYVENGQRAVEAAKAEPPDLILMDVQMPEMNGLEATKAIRAAGLTMPIIMQTANVMTEEVESYMRAGAQAHVGKPIDKVQLYKKLVELLLVT